MTEDEQSALEDMRDFITWSIKHSMEFGWILAGLGHDINGFLNGVQGFSPRTDGFAATLKKETEPGT